MESRYIFLVSFAFLLEFSTVYALEVCPQRLSDDITTYNTKARFDKLRKDKPRLTVNHIHHKNMSKGEEYDYVINFCGHSDAVTQLDKKQSAQSKKKVIGRLDGASLLVGGEDWLFIQYFHGDKYNKSHHCDGKARQSWISIRCECNGEKPTLKVIEEARYSTSSKDKETVCYYLFEYNHLAACSHEKKLSGGSIFLIVFISLVAAYLIFGFLFQRFVVGAKGFEQIPNYSFWRKVGNASADGCDFVCRREEHSNTYKGMADALDIDSSDDDKDDGLLPM